jgi:FkbM family methyltransferase
MTANKKQLLNALNKVSSFAQAGKFFRFLVSPSHYGFALLCRILYPINHKSIYRKVPLFFGKSMTVSLPSSTDIYLAGGKTHDSEIRLARFMIEHLKEGDGFLDIGAHAGYFSLLAATLNGTSGWVIAIEPSGSGQHLLTLNVSDWPSIQLKHVAISNQNETLTFYEFPEMYSEFNTLHPEQFEGKAWLKKYPPQQIVVPAVTLDEVLASCNHKPKIIKIDVEGAEDKVILGGAQSLPHFDGYLVMEFLPSYRKNESHLQAEALLKTYGFSSFKIDANGQLQAIESISRYMEEQALDSDNLVFKK